MLCFSFLGGTDVSEALACGVLQLAPCLRLFNDMWFSTTISKYGHLFFSTWCAIAELNIRIQSSDAAYVAQLIARYVGECSLARYGPRTPMLSAL